MRVRMVMGMIWAAVLVSRAAGGDGATPETPEESLIQAHLDAGEFGLAVDRARQLPEGRDAWLGRTAAAQSRAGATLAAHDTLRRIEDDRELANLAKRLAAQSTQAAPGGGTQADFDTLIELITTTVAPDSWDDVGGPGSIAEFPGGIYVDAAGVVRQIPSGPAAANLELDRRREASRGTPRGPTDPQRGSDLRKVSLPRLLRELTIRASLGEPPDATMRTLAGLQKIHFVFAYPETDDVVIAGPAGEWRFDDEGRAVSAAGRPVLRLDDLLSVLVNAKELDGRFGCSISPKKENLAATKRLLDQRRPLKPRQTGPWVSQLRETLGLQDVEVHGLDPRSHAARVLVAADYHMKLIGMGLEPAVPGVVSYLDLVDVEAAPSALDVLRWWFVLSASGASGNPQGNAFAFSQSVRLRSENELLADEGERVHTGESTELNQQFADSFTTHFAELATRYPVYAELENVLDMAFAAALIHQRGFGRAITACLADSSSYVQQESIRQSRPPREVPSIVNHRVIDRKFIIAGVSGGVSVDAFAAVRRVASPADSRFLTSDRDRSRARDERRTARWWWD